MKKIIGIISVALFPIISFAQEYGYRIFNRGSEYKSALPCGFLSMLFIILIPFLWIIVAIAFFIFWILMLVDAIKHTPEKTKLVWVVVIIFTHVIGALIYYFIEKRPRNKTSL
jgi:accessory gene regulator protein AgrB